MSRRSAKAETTACVNFFFILLLLIWAPAASQAVTVGEFPIAPAQMWSGISTGLAADAAGNIWFRDFYFLDRIARITPAGEVSVFTVQSAGQFTGNITAGPDGNIWYTKQITGKVVRITPAGEFTEFPLPIDFPGSITTGPDSNLWFTGNHQIGRMTLTGEVTLFTPPTPDSSPDSITPGPDGNLWFVEIAAGKIGRITPEGAITEFSAAAFDGDQSQLYAITAGQDGNLWFTDNYSNGIDILGRIGRITPAGTVVKFSIPDPTHAGSFSYGITAGPDGNLWFAVNNRSTIGRITPAGVYLTELAIPTAAAAPQKIISSPDGLLWFTESNTNKIGAISLEELSGYFPLATGTTWTYQKNEVGGFTRSVASVANGIARILFSDGYEMYMSSDANGIREHGEVDPTQGTLSFSPPVVFADSQSAPGISTDGSGTASMNVYPYSLGYASSSKVEGFETITVPAGTFRTARLSTTVIFPSYGFSTSQTNWVAPGVGVVKEISDDGTFLLTATSISDTTPDRFFFSPRFFMAPGSIATSETVTVTGITAAAPISISGGEYRIGNGAFTASPGTLRSGQTVTVHQTASSSFGTATTATLTVGGFSAPFQVATWPRPAGAELSRAIAVLRVLAGMVVTEGQLPPDATGDGRVGLAEALIVFQQLAGLRR